MKTLKDRESFRQYYLTDTDKDCFQGNSESLGKERLCIKIQKRNDVRPVSRWKSRKQNYQRELAL